MMSGGARAGFAAALGNFLRPWHGRAAGGGMAAQTSPAQGTGARAEACTDEVARARAEALLTRAAAQLRADTLLRDWLSPEQLAAFNGRRSFPVIGSAGTRFLIEYGVCNNVRELDADGGAIRGWCFVPEGAPALWPGDVMLAQKLALETDEPGALAVAYRWFGPPRPAREGSSLYAYPGLLMPPF